MDCVDEKRVRGLGGGLGPREGLLVVLKGVEVVTAELRDGCEVREGAESAWVALPKVLDEAIFRFEVPGYGLAVVFFEFLQLERAGNCIRHSRAHLPLYLVVFDAVFDQLDGLGVPTCMAEYTGELALERHSSLH